MEETFEQNLKNSFSKVKQDINSLQTRIDEVSQELAQQKQKIEEVIARLDELLKASKSTKIESSIGNEGVNQSINHLINQSINQQSFNQSNRQETPLKPKESIFIGNEGVNQSFNQSINQQSFNQSINQSQEQQIKGVADAINLTFSSLSKQELKLFLTIYQLEDEGTEPSYYNLSLKMQLSEHCIRSHLSSLLKKNAPILKKRLNNHTNLLSISRDFRALNLKQRLINLYYDSDPNQKTLFDI